MTEQGPITMMPEFMRTLDVISSGFQRSEILFTALEGGLFEQIEEPRTAEEVATALGWDARGTRMLLDGLLAIHLIEKHGGKYRNLPIASTCLVRGAAHDQTNILTHKANCRRGWQQLGEVVRTGQPALQEETRSGAELRAFICGMDDIAKESAGAVAEAVDFSRFRRMLDVGGGPATYAITFARKNPQLEATVFDLPEVVEIGKEQVAAAGLADRVVFVAGDMTKDALPGGMDLVFVSNLIHSFGPETNQALVQRCFDALDPGGALILKDFIIDPGRTGPAYGLIFALHMMVHTETGDTYTQEDVAGWTDAAGFVPGQLINLTPQSRLWMVDKP